MTWSETLQQAVEQSGLKDILRDSLGPFYEPFYKVFWVLWSAILRGQQSEIYWIYLFSALAVSLGAYLWQHSKARGVSFKKLFGFCLPHSISAHKSVIVDYKYNFTNEVLIGFIHFPSLIISTVLVGGYCTSLLQHIFGPVESQLEAGLSARIIYTVVMVLAVDTGFFLAHYLQHKVPFLWEFHKVHHSAEVLTPITNYRAHPMDEILQGFFKSSFGGIVTGIFGYLFYNGLDAITILNISAIVFVWYLTANLRHSHIWLSYGWALSHVFYRPAMHQIHHSNAERHVDKNSCIAFLGALFAFRSSMVTILHRGPSRNFCVRSY